MASFGEDTQFLSLMLQAEGFSFWHPLGFFGLEIGKKRINNQLTRMGCEKAILLAGNLSEHYKTICTEEQKQASINPENKSVYAQIFKDIQGCCVQFNNEMNAVKVHLPKMAAKSRSKRKRTAKSEQSE